MPFDQALFDSAMNHKSFERIKTLYEETGSIDNILPREFKPVAHEIHEVVRSVAEELPDEKEEEFRRTVFCESPIFPSRLRDMLSKKPKVKNDTDERYQRSVRALRIFLSNEKAAGNGKTISYSNKSVEELSLDGYWYVYRYDDDFQFVKRTILYIENSNQIHFNSLMHKFEIGKLDKIGSLVTVKFVSDTKSIEISFSITEKSGKLFETFNGILRSIIDHAPIAKPCVLLRAKKDIAESSLSEVCTVCHTSKILKAKDANDKIVSSKDEDVIIEYLARKSKHVRAAPFLPATLNSIKKRNDEPYHTLNKFVGQYIAFIPHAYEKGKSLSLIKLEIDNLGRTKETVLLTEKKNSNYIYKELEYRGKAAFLTNTLRLSNRNKFNQKSEYLFTVNLNAVKSELLQGITLDTDNAGYPCADACIALRYTSSLGFPFRTMIVRKSTPAYKKLNQLLKQKLNLTIDQYFFELYPSIRHKKI